MKHCVTPRLRSCRSWGGWGKVKKNASFPSQQALWVQRPPAVGVASAHRYRLPKGCVLPSTLIPMGMAPFVLWEWFSFCCCLFPGFPLYSPSPWIPRAHVLHLVSERGRLDPTVVGLNSFSPLRFKTEQVYPPSESAAGAVPIWFANQKGERIPRQPSGCGVAWLMSSFLGSASPADGLCG